MRFDEFIWTFWSAFGGFRFVAHNVNKYLASLVLVGLEMLSRLNARLRSVFAEVINLQLLNVELPETFTSAIQETVIAQQVNRFWNLILGKSSPPYI